MLHRSNKRKDKLNKPIEPDMAKSESTVTEQHDEETMSKKELLMHSEDAKKVYEDIMKLRESVNSLKQTGLESLPDEVGKVRTDIPENDPEAIIAAKKAIFEQAKKDALEQKEKQEELARKEKEAQIQQQKVLEAQRRAALIEEEAERKRLEAEEAKKAAIEITRKKALEAMDAARKAKEEQALFLKKKEEEIGADKAEFFDDEIKSGFLAMDVKEAKEELISAQKQQEATLDKISNVAEKQTNYLAQVQQQKLAQQQEKIKSEQEQVEAILSGQKEQRLERLTQEAKEREYRRIEELKEKRRREEIARALKAEKIAKAQALKAEKAARAQAEKQAKLEKLQAEKEERVARLLKEREAKQARLLAEREAKQARLSAEREAKRIKEEKRRLEKARKAEERELIKRARKDAEARARLEQMRLEAKSRADAELGGGLVNVQGLTVTTEIKEVAHISWRDFFNLKTKKERKAETESEKKKLERERKKRSEKARELVDVSLKKKRFNYEQTDFAKKFKAFTAFCEKRKTALLSTFAVVLVIAVGVAGIFNYYTAYAYSYNGKTLGIVKEKDDVLRITDLVQGALTEDKNIDVIIDARKDISFERVSTIGDVEIDTSEEVLKRLTYMGDLNVKAYGVYVNDKKVGAVESKDVAAEVLKDIKDSYVSGMEGAEIEEAVIIEKVEIKESNTNLEDVSTKDEMIDVLCSNVQTETLHEVVAEETISDIAKLYSMDEKDLIKDNPNLDKRNPEVGSKVVIKKEAPLLTVKITEKVAYEKVIKHEVQKKDSKEIYEGYSEVKQKGQDGLSEIESRITLVNGEQIEEDILQSNVKKEPVTEVILIGIKERPPSVGSGKYIWPFESGYTLTSGFKWRWGRLHEGIDLGTPIGNDVLAADGGVVTFAGYSGGYGYLIKVDHQNGMETRYAHNSKLLVSEGDKVFQGMHIAESGNSGRSTGPHLHFEIRVNGVAKDPLGFLP